MQTKPHPYVISERVGSVLSLTLNRPERANALHPDMLAHLAHWFAEARESADVNVVVLTGAGRNFCSGLDLDLLATWGSCQKLDYLGQAVALFRTIWTAPQPVVAAVNGAAVAGGFDLAAFCDIRLASTDAVFGQTEVDFGLVQIVHPLYKTIGLARAKELALTGRHIGAEEAHEIGLVNHVYPPEQLLDRAMELALRLAEKPRTALFETKRLTREAVDLDTDAALSNVEATFCRCLNTEEHHERLESYMAMRRDREAGAASRGTAGRGMAGRGPTG